jgi:hypothetical protein
MKKLLLVALILIVALSVSAATVSAETEKSASLETGPFEGTFNGIIHGDKGSSASVIFDLTQRGNQVQGEVIIGSGLFVSGGVCGTVQVPNSVLFASGQTLSKDPNHLVARSTFDVGSMEIKADVQAELSADGEELETSVKIDLPWFCGGDPVITSTLNRV